MKYIQIFYFRHKKFEDLEYEHELLINYSTEELIEDDKYYVDENLTELIDHFEFLKEFANGKIPKEEWKDYDFEGNYESWFNDYLNELYDLGDKRVVNKNNEIEKLIWIY
jgi:hypothetical protein